MIDKVARISYTDATSDRLIAGMFYLESVTGHGYTLRTITDQPVFLNHEVITLIIQLEDEDEAMEFIISMLASRRENMIDLLTTTCIQTFKKSESFCPDGINEFMEELNRCVKRDMAV